MTNEQAYIVLENCASLLDSGTRFFTEDHVKQFHEAYELAMMALRKTERKKGKWFWDENGMDWGLGAWCCSECGSKPETWWESDERYNPLRCAGGRFCGNCGANMRGEQGDNRRV